MTVRVREVKMLGTRAKALAKEQGFDENDLVIVRTTVNSLPEFEFEKITGSPITYLQKKITK